MARLTATSDEQVKPIQGKLPFSVEEYRFSISLNKLQVRYIYQWTPPIFTLGERGSTTVDFLILVAPLPEMVWIDGGFWHKGGKADQEKLLRTQVATRLVGSVSQTWHAVDTLDLATQALSDSTARRLFGGR